MTRGRLTRRLGALLAGTLLTACTASTSGGTPSTPPAPSPSRSSTPRQLSVVALGDSVPRGTNCDCMPYPELTANDLSEIPGRAVTAANDSVAGYTTDGVLRQLTSDQDVIAHVKVDAAIISEAASAGTAYVDLRAAFKGPDYAYDETHYLSDDGDHPNAAGHEQIARAAVDVITAAVHS